MNEHRNLIFMQKLLNCVRSDRILAARFIGSTKFKHSSSTHHVFNDPKIIVMGNGHGVFGAFLFELAE